MILLNGNYVILDVKNDIVVIRRIEQKDVFFVSKERKSLMQVKDVEIYKNCYLVRTMNNEIICYDNDLKPLSETYQNISDDYTGYFNYDNCIMYKFMTDYKLKK